MISLAAPPVPVPYVAPLAPLVPWWEWVLVGVTIAVAILYGTSLALAWWPQKLRRDAKPRSAKARRFTGWWGWTLPVMIILVLATALVDTRWKSHRSDLEDARWREVDAASVTFAVALGDAYGVRVNDTHFSVIDSPTREHGIVELTRADGTTADCPLAIATAGGERVATLDLTSCLEVDPSTTLAPADPDAPWWTPTPSS